MSAELQCNQTRRVRANTVGTPVDGRLARALGCDIGNARGGAHTIHPLRIPAQRRKTWIQMNRYGQQELPRPAFLSAGCLYVPDGHPLPGRRSAPRSWRAYCQLPCRLSY